MYEWWGKGLFSPLERRFPWAAMLPSRVLSLWPLFCHNVGVSVAGAAYVGDSSSLKPRVSAKFK